VHRLLQFSLLLTLAALANIAIALACAKWGNQWPDGAGPPSHDALSIPAGAEIPLAPSKPLKTGVMTYTKRNRLCTRETWERWLEYPDIDTLPHSRSHSFHLLEFGFPFRSLNFAVHTPPSPADPKGSSERLAGLRGGWPILTTPEPWPPIPKTTTAKPVRVLPLIPMPLGFAANTIIYAAALWPIVYLLPRTILRWSRRRRKLCPYCAYPTGPSPVCTECGRPVRNVPRVAGMTRRASCAQAPPANHNH
jgi:hypothetical protein